MINGYFQEASHLFSLVVVDTVAHETSGAQLDLEVDHRSYLGGGLLYHHVVDPNHSSVTGKPIIVVFGANQFTCLWYGGTQWEPWLKIVNFLK